jgi:hypothetical protein
MDEMFQTGLIVSMATTKALIARRIISVDDLFEQLTVMRRAVQGHAGMERRIDEAMESVRSL